jgi:hypothetical protein
VNVETTGAAPAGEASELGNPAAAQPNAATTDPGTGAPEGGSPEGQEQKTFTQKELDEILQKRIAKAEARAERRVLRTLERVIPQPQSAPQQQAQQREDNRPSRRDGEADDDYLERLTDWKLEQRDSKAKAETQQRQAATLAQKTESIYAEAEKLAGFDRESFDELPLTKPIVEALIDSDAPAKLMHYMAANPAEVERIAKLSPARQAAELGKLEAALPKTPKTSKAPDPIGNPVGNGSATAVQHDPNRMSHEQYREWRKKNGARWAN